MKVSVKVAAVCMICAGTLFAQDNAVHVELAEHEIVGLALYPDGETPVVDLPVRVWSVDKKEMVFRSRTDKTGAFRVPRVESGENYLFIGRVRINLKMIKPDAGGVHQYHDIIMVVDRGMVLPARPNLMEVLVAPVIMRPPEDPPVISP
ncbi:hypothetical protein BVX97_04320 [bacterium E08(2017)]|nr:hypothetical protein BVX97_04320 [bacterium E08(2017)]